MDAKLDFLQELGNIGAGHATTALSHLLNGQRFDLIIPEALMLPFQEVGTFIGGHEQVVAGIYIEMSGDAVGHMAFLLPLESAVNLVNLLTGEERSELDEMGLSALQEVGNIMIASYLNALSDLTGLLLMPSVPGVAIDMAGAVWQSILAGAQVADTITLIKAQFSTNSIAIEGNIIFLPNEDDFQKIARILGLEDF